MMEKRHGGGGGGGFTVLRLLAAAVLAFLLPQSAGAADDAKWHAHAHPVAHAGLPPLSAPPPTAGADDLPPPVPVPVSFPPSRAPGQRQQAAPHFGFPLQPGPGAAAPGTAPAGEGYPFIGSNPTVPLPTGMTDTSTVLPLPDTGDAATKVVGSGSAASVRAPVSMIALGGLFFATMLLFLSKI
ncbi:U1 small nuclear ribonucleoprotein C [Sorghum bicolor]|uniref:Uncharacterized protein n=1 Tax=Sorghum bicolor TaxID=4558 RepID=C5XIQ2_SORBI|nr:U1 small nuclear ribonucleoprotein C [Sorghum bicolor]EES02110.1 hypothetical protein SORBI_3003G438100 [Sorghum bicolor]|eukprot:XP_002456990.1 U1 small nuclear ribonucleoprotein C [Sorghum bicolor]